MASEATAEEMTEVTPELLGALADADGPTGELFRHFFGAFEFGGITVTPPTRTFSDRLGLDVAGTAVELVEVGPAHTRGDTIAHVPEAGVVFTGDICFIEGTPIVWAGPLSGWVDALDLIVDLDPDVVVPGHGPVTDVAGVLRVRDYLTWVDGEARDRHARGMTAEEAARDIADRPGRVPLRDLERGGAHRRQRGDRLPPPRPRPPAGRHRHPLLPHGRPRGLGADLLTAVGTGPVWGGRAVSGTVGRPPSRRPTMLADQIQTDLTTAMKARDELTATVLRSALAAIKEARVSGDAAHDLGDDDVPGPARQGGQEAGGGGRGLRRCRARRAGRAGAGRGRGPGPVPAVQAHRRRAGGPGRPGAGRRRVLDPEGHGRRP